MTCAGGGLPSRLRGLRAQPIPTSMSAAPTGRAYSAGETSRMDCLKLLPASRTM